MKSRKSAMYRLFFADEKGAVYDHPRLLAAARSGGDVVRPSGRPLPLPEGATLCVLPGRRPVGFDPGTGEQVVLDCGHRARSRPHAIFEEFADPGVAQHAAMVAGGDWCVDPSAFVAWLGCQPDADRARRFRLLGSRGLSSTVTETRRCPSR